MEERGLLDQIAKCNQRLRYFPRDLATLLERGEAYAVLSDAQADKNLARLAKDDFARALWVNPRSAEGWEKYGRSQLLFAENESAIKSLDQAIGLGRKTYEVFLARGRANRDFGKLEAAIADYGKAISLVERAADGYLERGGVFYALGEFDRAIADFNQTIAADPKDQYPLGARAFAYFAKNEIDKAVADVWAAIRLKPDDLGNSYEPRTAKQLSAEALAHGEAQVRQMLRDRPAMGENLTAGDEIWTWAVRKFAGEDGCLIDWDATNPAPGVMSDAPYGNGPHPSIRVRKKDIHDVERDCSFDELWSSAVWELHNASAHEKFAKYADPAANGKISRDEYVVGYFDCEEQTLQKTRVTFLEVFLPWLRDRDLEIKPENWNCGVFWSSRPEFLRACKEDGRWQGYGQGYDLILAEFEYNRGSYLQAEILLKRVLSSEQTLEPANVAHSRYLMACVYWAKPKLREAIEEIDKAIAADPDKCYYFIRGRLHVDANDLAKAIDDFTHVIDLLEGQNDPDYIEVFDNRGYALKQQGNYDEAIADFDESIRRDSTRWYPYAVRGEAKCRHGDYDGAIVDLDEAIRLDSQDAFSISMRGYAYRAKQEWDLALADFSRSIQLDPKASDSYFRRGWLNSRAGKYREMLADYRKAVALAPETADHQNALAWVLATCPDKSIRNGKQAVAAATKACELTKWQDSNTIDTLACALAEAGRYQEAVERMKLVRKLDPTPDEKTKAFLDFQMKSFQNHQPYRAKPGE